MLFEHDAVGRPPQAPDHGQKDSEGLSDCEHGHAREPLRRVEGREQRQIPVVDESGLVDTPPVHSRAQQHIRGRAAPRSAAPHGDDGEPPSQEGRTLPDQRRKGPQRRVLQTRPAPSGGSDSVVPCPGEIDDQGPQRRRITHDAHAAPLVQIPPRKQQVAAVEKQIAPVRVALGDAARPPCQRVVAPAEHRREFEKGPPQIVCGGSQIGIDAATHGDSVHFRLQAHEGPVLGDQRDDLGDPGPMQDGPKTPRPGRRED